MNSVICMYSKFGRMDLAYKVFGEMEVKNVSSLTTMIAGYAAQGHAVESLWVLSVKGNDGVFVALSNIYASYGLERSGEDKTCYEGHKIGQNSCL